MPEDPKAVVSAFVKEVQNDGNIEAAGDYIAPDVVDHSAMPGLPPGLEGAKAIFAMIRSGLPDHDAVIHDQIAEGDKVVTRKSFTGTHDGEFLGVPPTGRRVTIDVIDVVRVREGRIVEHWNVVDLFGALRQMEATPGGA
jgi:predicted ester cyclase